MHMLAQVFLNSVSHFFAALQFRDILYLYHIYGYNFKEISHLLSLTVENAKKRAQRARLMLKQNLEKAGLYNEQ